MEFAGFKKVCSMKNKQISKQKVSILGSFA
jgi:hypothetical protein